MTGPDEASDDAQRRYRRARDTIAAASAGGLRGVPGVLRQVCNGLAVELHTPGVAVRLMFGGHLDGVAAASSTWIRDIDDIQFTVGEGPCHEAFRTRRPVLTPDLLHVPGNPWPGFAPLVVAAGIGAMFAFPLHVGATVFGVMDVYAKHPGSLNADELATALTFAEVATDTILDVSFNGGDSGIDMGLVVALDYRAEIHQAQGMVMVDLGVDAPEALARLRAHAFANDQQLIDLARAVIGGTTIP